MNEKLENWVVFPRKIASDYRNRLLTKDEYSVYVWLRLNTNQYGISTTSLSNLVDDILSGTSQNYANKKILSLKKKRYIYYENRAGCRGSFDIHIGDFILPNKSIKTLDRFFNTEIVTASDTPSSTEQAELAQTSTTQSQSFGELKMMRSKLVSSFSVDTKVRARNNDTDNNKDTSSFPFRGGTNLSNFEPKTLDENFCLEIAHSLNEKDINFILSSFKKYNKNSLEEVWRVFKEEEKTIEIKNRGAYFNDLLKRHFGRQ